MAAVLASGPGATLSHASAAALWDLRASNAQIVDVSVTGRAGRMGARDCGSTATRTLRDDEVTTRDGIPVTTPSRTILDLAATLQHIRLERLLDQAEILELTDYPALDALRPSPPRPSTERGQLRRTFTSYVAGTTLKRSDLEERFFVEDLP